MPNDQPCVPKVTLLLAARPGHWRNALEAYLRAMPQLEVIVASELSGDLPALLASQQVQTLVLEGAMYRNNQAQLLAELHGKADRLHTVIIADTLHEYQAALEAGIDAVLMKAALPNPIDPDYFMRPAP